MIRYALSKKKIGLTDLWVYESDYLHIVYILYYIFYISIFYMIYSMFYCVPFYIVLGINSTFVRP